MKIKKNQKGGVLGTLIIFVVMGFLFIYGIQVAFAYIGQQTLKGAVRTTLVDVKTDEDSASPAKVKDIILKKIAVNDLDVSSSDILVTRDGRYFVVNVNYSKEIGMGNNAKLVLDLSFEESTPR